jgi:hypothetical protein
MKELQGLLSLEQTSLAIVAVIYMILKFGPEWIKVLSGKNNDKDQDDKNKNDKGK